jgi:predicted AlkP superfamily pyrophosphatase or phosphodiesterase
MNGAATGPDMGPSKGGTHGYFPDFSEIRTGFIAYGPSFAPHTIVPEMGLEDIAPLIAKLLNIPFKAHDGVLMPGIIKNGK